MTEVKKTLRKDIQAKKLLFLYFVFISGTKDKNCWSVNYISRRICALEDSSVNISSKYSHPDSEPPKDKLWYKIKRSGMKEAEELIEAAGRVEYHDIMEKHHILRINNLKKNDSAEYKFILKRQNGKWNISDSPGVTLVVTGNSVNTMQMVSLFQKVQCEGFRRILMDLLAGMEFTTNKYCILLVYNHLDLRIVLSWLPSS